MRNESLLRRFLLQGRGPLVFTVGLQIERLLNISKDNFRILIAVDLDKQTATTIIVDERSRGALINIKTIAYSSFVVVVTLIHFATTLRADLISFSADIATIAANAT